MTMPIERTRSLVQTREFLQDLAHGDPVPDLPLAIRQEAFRLLRHFPMDYDIAACARHLPQSWADPALLKPPSGA